MKKLILFLLISNIHSAQNLFFNEFEINYFYGNTLKHQPNIRPLVQSHPIGVLVSLHHKTNGEKDWHQSYNFPEFGTTFVFQDYKGDYLKQVYFIGGHINFYFLKRHLHFRLSQGIAYTNSPYNQEQNNKNIAFGSNLLAGSVAMLQFKKEKVLRNFGIQSGLLFTHFSNGSTKSPNTGINTLAINAGIIYDIQPDFIHFPKREVDNSGEKIRYNITARTGVNEAFVNAGLKPFLHLGFHFDKKINKKSALQLGTDFFINESRREYINYSRIAYKIDKEPIPEKVDYKRAGLFIGHELFISNFSIETQVGHYVYQPVVLDGEGLYARVGAKYYFTKNLFSSFHVKTHYFQAENLEIGLGLRL